MFEYLLKKHLFSFMKSHLRSITKSYYRNSVGAVLAYDICNMEVISFIFKRVLTASNVQSYKHIPVWLMEAKRHIEPHQATFLMVGCKKDLARTEREVPKETAQVIMKSMYERSPKRLIALKETQPNVCNKENNIFQALADYHGIPFLETSAKTGENVEEAFSLISQAIYDKVNIVTVSSLFFRFL